jgi:hypothetical protein
MYDTRPARLYLRKLFEDQAQSQRDEQATDDARGSEAAARFDWMAGTVDAIPADVIDAFAKIDRDDKSVKRFGEMLREIGLQTTPETAEDFVRKFIADQRGEAPSPSIPARRDQ